MKKRVLSALLVLCMACSMVSTVWANQATPETATPETAATASPAPSPTPDVSAYPARTVEQTIEDAGVTVKVDVPAGSLPADAQLTAELIGSSADDAADQAVTDVAEELTAANVDYDGFVALDISFVGADGAKIEPLQPVSVSFSLPADLLPAEADPATLAVQHLAEDETGEVETVETVADVADETAGTVTVETGAAALSLEDAAAALPADAEVKAEFEVDGFSVFTITWNRDNDSTDSIDFTLVDTDGNPIELNLQNGQTLSFELGNDETVYFDGDNGIVDRCNIQEIRGTVNGVATDYVFQNATLITSEGSRHPVVYAKRARQNIFSDYNIQFGDAVFDATYSSWSREQWKGLELVYRRADDPETVVEPEPAYGKTATKTGDETYKIEVSVSGDVGSSTQKQKVDVLFIVDQSPGMDNAWWTGTNKRTLVAEQASELAYNLSNNNNVDARFAVIGFSTNIASQDSYDDAVTRLTWSDDASEVYSEAYKNAEEDNYQMHNTNYEAGILLGRSA